MDPKANGSGEEHQIVGDPGTPSLTVRLMMDFVPIDIPTVETGAVRPSESHESSGAAEADAARAESRYGGRSRFRVPPFVFVRKIKSKWGKLWSSAVRWCKTPENFPSLVLLASVGAGLLLLLMLMTGMLDDAIPGDEQRKKWTEVVSQILNALYTVLCLYYHPRFFHHLVLLLRWNPEGDREEIRKVYCKDGAARPHDRTHMLVVVVVIHVTCFAQYLCCALFWWYTPDDRPSWALNIGYGLGTGGAIFAGLYAAYSPLGRKQQEINRVGSNNRRARVVVSSPEWSGGLLDCCDDETVCALSATCTFCVFGWNMERLGFGNMYVHSLTFILVCVSPLLVFSVAALNIHGDGLRDTAVAAGVLLSLCGFLYGGFWRAQMRKQYGLPGGRRRWCCGGAAVGDCARWLFCWSCALAQEVRTANLYDVEDKRFVEHNGEGRPMLVPLPRETTTVYTRSLSCPPPNIDNAVDGSSLGPEMATAMNRSATYHPTMRPPLPPLMDQD